jgi:predicted DNA-binding transcriptional regulator AlpA
MGRRVDLDDLVDARGVAEILGFSHPNTVSSYQHRYGDMPRPALDLGERRVKLWLRPEIEAWARELEAAGRNKPGRRPSK